jgi:hypothetical protein
MLQSISSSVIKDFLNVLKEHKDFYAQSDDKKLQSIESTLKGKYTTKFTSLFIKLDKKSFVLDMKATIDFIKGDHAKPSELVNTITSFLTEDITNIIDQLDTEFFFIPEKERFKTLSKHFTLSHLGKYMLEKISCSTYQELNEEIYTTLNNIKEIPVTLVQTPVELNADQKLQVRKHFLKENTYSFVEFQITPSLLGGIKVFQNGHIIDNSWRAKISSLNNMN